MSNPHFIDFSIKTTGSLADIRKRYLLYIFRISARDPHLPYGCGSEISYRYPQIATSEVSNTNYNLQEKHLICTHLAMQTKEPGIKKKIYFNR